MTTSPARCAIALMGVFLVSCEGARSDEVDAGIVDTGLSDAGVGEDTGDVDLDVDAGDVEVDGGSDAGFADAGDVDAGLVEDAGNVDAGGVEDAGDVDAGFPDSGVDELTPAREVCASGRVGLPENAGALGDPALVEASGLAASWLNPDVLWAHNDSGDSARVFAVGNDGSARGRFALADVDAVDVEDVAVSLCPDAPEPCVWLADTGDNDRVRNDARLIVFAEPFVGDGVVDPLAEVAVSEVRTIPFSYDDGAVDVEALAVSADGTRVFLFEKVDASRARVFALAAPFVDDGSMVARVVSTLNSPGLAVIQYGRMITAADLHTTGSRLLVRVYTGIFEYRFASNGNIDVDAAFAGLGSQTASLLLLGPRSEPQGEAIAYDSSGTGLFSVSEDRNGRPGQILHHYSCQP